MDDINDALKMIAMCNHRSEDNTHDLLQYYDDKNSNVVKCSRCKCSFTPLSSNAKPADDIKKVIDIIQTIKVMWPDMPKDTAEKLYPILPILEDLDAIYAKAAYQLHRKELQLYQTFKPV